MHRVLLGSAGTGTAFAAAASLRRHWANSVRIVGIDINPPHLVTTSLLTDRFEQVPRSDAPEFVTTVLRLIDAYGIDTYAPFLDMEVLLSAELRRKGMLPATVVLAPPPEHASTCLDKWLAWQWMAANGVRTPRTSLLTDPGAAGPGVLKPRCGFGSRDVRRVGPQELDGLSVSDRSEFVLQQPCDPPEITVDVFHDPQEAFLRVSCRERLEVKAGVCTKARVHEDPNLVEIAAVLARGLKISGGFCFQAMRLEGRWAVTDINARLGAGTALSVAAGLDFFAASFALAWGLDYARYLPRLAQERFVTRQYSEFVMS